MKSLLVVPTTQSCVQIYLWIRDTSLYRTANWVQWWLPWRVWHRTPKTHHIQSCTMVLRSRSYNIACSQGRRQLACQIIGSHLNEVWQLCVRVCKYGQDGLVYQTKYYYAKLRLIACYGIKNTINSWPLQLGRKFVHVSTVYVCTVPCCAALTVMAITDKMAHIRMYMHLYRVTEMIFYVDYIHESLPLILFTTLSMTSRKMSAWCGWKTSEGLSRIALSPLPPTDTPEGGGDDTMQCVRTAHLSADWKCYKARLWIERLLNPCDPVS